MKNRDHAANVRHVLVARKKMGDLVRALKSQPCTDCGVSYPHYVMDFDHVRGEKKFNVSSVISSFKSKQRVLDEIAKCEVVCSNCHRTRTWIRQREKFTK
jgi:hypothetical protein